MWTCLKGGGDLPLADGEGDPFRKAAAAAAEATEGEAVDSRDPEAVVVVAVDDEEAEEDEPSS